MNDVQYKKAISQAKLNLSDIKSRSKNSIGDNFDDVCNEIFTPEELTESDFRVAIIGELIKARNELGISQKKLEELSGIRQPIIARMELGNTSPNINTLLKVLAPLGKTLYVGDIK